MFVSMMSMVIMMIVMTVRRGGRSLGRLPPDEHIHFERVNAAAIDFLEIERGAQFQRRRGLTQQVGGNARLDKRPEQHVAADAGKSFKISDAHAKMESLKAQAGKATDLSPSPCHCNGKLPLPPVTE